jgi:hypothetical protein
VIAGVFSTFLLGEITGRDEVFSSGESFDTGEAPEEVCESMEEFMPEETIEPNALALGSVAALPSIRFFIGVPEADWDGNGNEVGEAEVLR